MVLVDPDRRRRAVDVAQGRAPADLLLTNVQLVNTFTGEVYPAQVVVAAGIVAALLDPGDATVPAVEVVDGEGRYAVPGLVDSHVHIESTMVLPPAFAAAVVPHGVLTVIADPHEIANVMGTAGIELMAEASRGLPLDIFLQAPSCVPATALETAGAELGPDVVDRLLAREDMLALGEVMDFHAVLAQEGRVVEVLRTALRRGTVVEGHAPGLSGPDLAAYVAAGATSDHTLVTADLATERLRNGVTLQLQMKSLTPETISAAALRARSLNLCLVTDDTMPDDLVASGHLDEVLRTAVARGLEPIEAIRAATLAPARRMGLEDRGAIAPGRLAHLVLTPSLENFRAEMVFHAGRLVARDGEFIAPLPSYSPPAVARQTLRIPPPPPEAFQVSATGSEVTVRVIEMYPQTTYTGSGIDRLAVKSGVIDWESSDLCLAVVFERHGRSGMIGYGFVRGALRQGAVATTWAHDSHNLLVVGRSAAEMAVAARWVVEAGGGMVAVRGTEVLGAVRLPIAGIISDRPVSEVAVELGRYRRALEVLGFIHASPIMALSVLTLPVSPALKLTDRGLVDVQVGRIVPLIVD